MLNPTSSNDTQPASVQFPEYAESHTVYEAPNNVAPDLFAQWSPQARAVLAVSQQEALRLDDHFIGEEHLLLALIHMALVHIPASRTAMVLRSAGVELGQARALVAARPHRAARIPFHDSQNLRLSHDAKEVIRHAVDEARNLQHPAVDLEHLLLALTQRQSGVTYATLSQLGATPQHIHEQLLSVLLTKPLEHPVDSAATPIHRNGAKASLAHQAPISALKRLFHWRG